MRIQTKLSIVFSITATFLLAAGIAAILLIQHLNTILGEISFYNFQTEYVAKATDAIRRYPTETAQNLARLGDLEKFTRTDAELTLVRNARQQLTQEGSLAGAIAELDELAAHYRRGTVAAHNRLTEIHQRAVIGVIVAIADAVLLLILLMYLVRHWLLNPLLHICASTYRLAGGDLSQPIANGGGPEIAELAAALDTMAVSHKDLSERAAKAERYATVGEACSHVVHSFHGPLATIRSLAHNQRESEHVAAEARGALDHIIATAEKLQRWTRDLVSTVHPLEPKRVRQPLEPIVHDALSLLQPSITEKMIKVDLESNESLPDVSVDRTMLEQALVAVLANAIAASPDEARIVIAMANKSDGLVALTIQDEGEGMTEEVKRKAFAPFFTTKTNGAGLGLAVAQRIVTQHGGRIDMESEPDKGTRVHISLPAALANHTPATAGTSKKR